MDESGNDGYTGNDDSEEFGGFGDGGEDDGKAPAYEAGEPVPAKKGDGFKDGNTATLHAHSDRTPGFKAPIGRGDIETTTNDGKTTNKSRPALITMQPGQARGTLEEENKNLVLYLPSELPVAKDAPGHVVFALDVPGVYAKDSEGRLCLIIDDDDEDKTVLQAKLDKLTDELNALKTELDVLQQQALVYKMWEEMMETWTEREAVRQGKIQKNIDEGQPEKNLNLPIWTPLQNNVFAGMLPLTEAEPQPEEPFNPARKIEICELDIKATTVVYDEIYAEYGARIYALQQARSATRIIINRTRNKGAQISFEKYVAVGEDAATTHAEHGLGEPVSACRETISITTFNVGDVVQTDITMETASTYSNLLKGGTMKGPSEKTMVPYHEPGMCDGCFDPCLPCCCGSDEVREELTEGKVSKGTDKGEPSDMQTTTTVHLTPNTPTPDKNDSTFDFYWTVVSVNKPETDLSFTLADSLKKTCYDPQSAARTLCNVIHYYQGNSSVHR